MPTVQTYSKPGYNNLLFHVQVLASFIYLTDTFISNLDRKNILKWSHNKHVHSGLACLKLPKKFQFKTVAQQKQISECVYVSIFNPHILFSLLSFFNLLSIS